MNIRERSIIRLRSSYGGTGVLCRGDRREDIYHDDVDRQDFLKTLAETCQKTDGQVQAYGLMSNYFRVVLETPNGYLVDGMHWRLSTYTIRLNRRLETYLNGIRPQLLGERHSDKLFLSYRGNAIDAHSVGDLVKRHAGLANVKKHVTPHVWRHTCATHLVQNHANLRHVQDLLGHGSLANHGTVFAADHRRFERGPRKISSPGK